MDVKYYGIDYDDNSLKHYGVIGMKWGVRKAQNLRTKALTQTGAKKKLTLAKAKKIETKTKALAGDAYKKTLNDSMGKTLAKYALMGSYGALEYNKAREKGNSRLYSGLTGAANSYVNNYSLGLRSYMAPRQEATRSDKSDGRLKAYKNATKEYEKAKQNYKASKRKS